MQAVAPDKIISPYTLTPKNIDNISSKVMNELERDDSLHSGIAGLIHPSFIADHIDTTTLRGQKGSQGEKGNTGRASGMRSKEITFSPHNVLRHYGEGSPLDDGELHKNFIGRFHTNDVVEIYIVFTNELHRSVDRRSSYFKVKKEPGTDSDIISPRYIVPYIESVECDIPVSLYFRNLGEFVMGDVYELFFDTHYSSNMNQFELQNVIKHEIYLRTSSNPDGLPNEDFLPDSSLGDGRIHPCVNIKTKKNYKKNEDYDSSSAFSILNAPYIAPLTSDSNSPDNLDIKRGIHVQSLCIDDVCLNKDDIENIKNLP